MKARRMIRVVLGVVAAAVMVGGGFFFMSMADYKHRVADVQLKPMDLTDAADGKYQGNCDLGWVKAAVAVTVKDRHIQSVQLVKHENGRGKAAEALIDEIMRQQKTDIDVVSGATASSKAILKAAENALDQANGKNVE